MADPVSIGISVALTAANMALTAMQTFEGPRLTDLKGTVADYGTPRNYVYGTRRIACPCFFAEPIKERKKKRKGKGGKQVSYVGYLTFAVHLADHRIDQVRKVWFDQHLVYDATGSGDPLFPLGDGYDLASAMRIYPGTSDQEPDPRMQAYLEAKKGPGTCPAFLDQAYLFFEDIPAEQIGNRFPQVRAEINVGGTAINGVILDFENGLYTINGASVPVEAAVEEGYLQFSYDQIVAGVGLRATDSASDYGPFLSAGAFAAATGENPAGGVRATVDFNIDVPVPSPVPANGDGAFIQIGITDSATAPFGPVWFADLYWVGESTGGPGENFSTLYALPSSGPGVDTVIPMTGPGDHVIVVELGPGNLSASVDNAEPTNLAHSITMMPGAFWINAGVSTGDGSPPQPPSATIRRVEITPLAPLGGGGQVTLGSICTDIAQRCGLAPGEYDFSALDQEVPGYSWTQGSGRQIVEPLLTLWDSQLRPHDFLIEGIKNGGAAGAGLSDGEFVAGSEPGQHYKLTFSGETDLPQRVTMTFADFEAEQQPNTAVVQRSGRATRSVRDQALDAGTLALQAPLARQLVERYHRRMWFARGLAEFGLSRRQLAIEPGDVRPISLDGQVLTMVCDKLTFQADGAVASEWIQDDPALAALSGASGAAAAGHVPSAIYNPADTTGAVLDLPLLSDLHDQSAPFAYLLAAPKTDTGSWPGADYAVSDTGELDSYNEGWGAVSGSQAAVFGTVTGALNPVDPWVFDDGSSISVTIESGVLTGATRDELLANPQRNQALIGSEVVQFRTATLTAPLTYTLTGFVRGCRGTEAAVAGHATGARFVLLEGAAVVRTLGAAELGDTDWYVASTTGRVPDQSLAEPLAFTGQAHRPYAAVRGRATLSGGDWSITATRRTRLGGAAVNGQDVPLGEASEAWEADIMDGTTVKRTLTGTALPLVYTAAMQTADWGGAQSSLTVRLYQMNPTLNLRGGRLTITG